ncbi:MAG: Ig-like domain-containing protein [Patescibacteria group bacterium]
MPTLNLQRLWFQFFKPKILLGIAAVILVALGLALFLRQSPTPQFSFDQNQKVAAGSDLRFGLPFAMDRRSVEENLTIPVGLAGDLKWLDDQTLVFDPAGSLTLQAVYKFELDRQALRADGQRLGKTLEYQFTVSGDPILATHAPADATTEIPVDAEITLVFDRPMVPLTIVQNKTNPENWSVKLTPEISGRWRWLGTTTAKFVPTEKLPPATHFTVSIPTGLTTLSGDPTTEDFSFSFDTVRPQVVSTNPAPGSREAGPSSKIELNFNLPIDLASADEKITLAQKKLNPKNPQLNSTVPLKIKNISYGTKEVDKKMMTDETVLVVEPAVPLALDANYTVTVAAGIMSTLGGLGSPTEYPVDFATVGAMVVERGSYSSGLIELQFSNELSDVDLAGEITISPKVDGWDELELRAVQWDPKQISFYPQLVPSTTYTLTVDQSVHDRFGQNLPKDYALTFKTEPIPSKVFIHSTGDFGIFESGKAPIYYLNAVNVSRMDVALAKLSLADFLDIRNQRSQDYEYSPNLSQFADYQKWSFAPPKNKHDEWEAIPFDLNEKTGEPLSSGIYVMTLQAPEYKQDWGDYSEIVNYQYFALTNIGLTLKYSGGQALVFAIDLQTGAPLPDTLIKFNSLGGAEVVTGKTDADGFFTTKLDLKKFTTPYNEYQPEFWVTAEHGADFAFIGSNWNNGIEPWSFGFGSDFRGTDFPNYQMDSYIYTERPVYRPGDTVHFKGIVRLRDSDGVLNLPGEKRQALVKINDAKGNEIYNKTLNLTQFGSFSDELPLDSAAALGDYNLVVQTMPDADIGNNYGSASFSVLAYRKPEYRVDLTPAATEYFDKDQIKVGIEGAYYFGAPLANAPVNWRIKTTDYFFNQYTDDWYSFALEDAWCWWDCTRSSDLLLEGSGELDADGKLALSFPVDLADKSVSQVLTLEADVTDPNNQIVSNRVSVPVHKSSVYVGIRPEDYSVQPGENASLKIVTVSPEGKVLAGQKVQIQLFSREWNSIKKKNVDGSYYYDNAAKDTFVSETSVATDADGKAIAKIKIPNGGQFVAVASTADSKGRAAKASTSIYAWSDTYVNWPHENNDRIDVIADKPEYAVGDTAKLLVKSPYQGANVKALITVERENIIRKEVVTITSNAQSIEIPITKDLIPNAFVSVVIIKPRAGETFNENGLDTGAPAFKIGYAKLLVETKPKELQLTLKTDKQKYGPGETVRVTLQATDAAGKPIETELSLGTVDMSVLALTGFELPDLVKNFYAQRGLGVMTSELLTYLIERFKPGSKGGGGADVNADKRGDFQDTAYWNPRIVTDQSGVAQIDFKLPDNLTTWKLLAIGSTRTSEFGAVAEEIVETKKVIVRSVRPRFAVVGDEIELGAIVHNFLDQDAEFAVSLTGAGFESRGATAQKIKVAAGGQSKINFPITVSRTDKLTLDFKATTAEGRDEIEESIPVYIFGTPQSVATSGYTEDSATETLSAPTADEASSGNLDISVSPTLATYLPGGLDYLVQFPYGCAEQTVSSFLPNIAVAQLQGFEAFKITTDAELENNITSGLQKLYSFQRGDGGFGYWAGSTESYPYLTAYIVFALNQTQKANYAVDAEVLNRAHRYLTGVLRNQNLKQPIDLAVRAYILFVLAEGGSTDISLLNNLYEQRKNLPLFSQAQLTMALQKYGSEESLKKARALLDGILANVKTEARGASFVEATEDLYRPLMNTDTRTTATVLQALVRLDSENALIPRIVRYLLAVREDGHWDTTQSTTVSILTLVEFLKNTGELSANMTSGVSVNGKQILTNQFNQKNILTRGEVEIALNNLKQGKDNEIKIGKTGTGRLYYDVLFSYFYTADDLPPAEEGFGIVRELLPLKSGEFDSALTEAQLGETYKVKLTITVPADRHFVAIESPLPAGMESIDTNLLTSQQTLLEGAINADSCQDYWSYECWQNNLWHFNHRELRDDQVFLFADDLPAGVYEYEYLVRATTPGKFRLRPARAYEMYFPETFGQTDGTWFEVKE